MQNKVNLYDAYLMKRTEKQVIYRKKGKKIVGKYVY